MKNFVQDYIEMNTDPIEPLTTTMELRVALLERDREAPLTPEQRAKLPGKLRELDESIAALRAFHLVDGGSEPALVFHALPPNSLRLSADAGAPDAASDGLIAPTVLTVATPIDQSLNESTEPWGGPRNLAGWPSISIPMGYGKENLPLGVELIGPPLGEQILLSLAMAYQREIDWHCQHPSL